MKTINKISSIFILISFLAVSCTKSDPDSDKGTSRLMIINLSPDAPAINAYADTVKINTVEISFSAGTDYLPIAAGNKKITIKESSTSTTLLNTPTLSFAPNLSYSLFFVDSVSKASAIYLYDNLIAPVSGKANFRILNLSPNTPGVDFILRSGADSIAITNKTFKQIPDLLAVDAKTYTIKVKLAGTQTVIAPIANFTMTNGKIYTIFLKGFTGGIFSQALDIGYVENN